MSVEGIGGLKWSVERKELDPAHHKVDHVYVVMEGTREIASVRDVKVAKLICGAPQLWAAANALLANFNLRRQHGYGCPHDGDPLADPRPPDCECDESGETEVVRRMNAGRQPNDYDRLAEQVARCVGKASWKEVAQ